jgi:hypothetical protein
MPKQKHNPNQLSFEPLFFAMPKKQESEEVGSKDVSVIVREVLSEILSTVKATAGDRFEIASKMSRLCNRDISKYMLDRYCASADEWRFPLEALPALVEATGSYDLLELIVEKCGCKLLRGEEAWIAEVGALTIQEKQTKKRLSELNSVVPEDVLDRLTKAVASRLGGEK